MKPLATNPHWTLILTDEDWAFLKRFLLASGSLKDLAAEYGISYPTIRIRLDSLIAKVRAADVAHPPDEFTLLIQSLVIDGQLNAAAAKRVLQLHHHQMNR